MQLRAITGLIAFVLAMASPSAAQVGPPPPPPPPPAFPPGDQTPVTGTATLSGVVIDSDTGKAVAGAIVSLSAFGPASVRPPRQMTDASGRFLFTGLPASQNYQLTAARPGYFDGAFGRSTPRGSLRPIALNDGQHLADVKVLLFRSSAISGTVVDEFGEPVVGIAVSVQARIPVGGEARWVSGPVTKTDDRGAYRIPLLPPGTYVVMVPSVQHAVPAGLSLEELTGWSPENIAAAQASGREIPLQHTAQLATGSTERVLTDIGFVGPALPRADGRPQIYPSTFHPSARAPGSATPIVLGTGDERSGIDIQLRPVLAASVSGRVVGPPDAVAGLTLRLLPAGSEDGWVGLETATTRVRDDGSFTFVNVPDGQYTVLANRFVAGYVFNPTGTLLTTIDRMFRPPSNIGSESGASVSSAPSGTMFWMLSPREPGRYSGRASVEVAGRGVDDVVVTMNGGMSISGRVVFETSASGKTATFPFLQVRAEPANGDPSLGQPLAQVTMQGTEGPFQIDGVLPGDYLLRLFPGVGVIKSVTWNERDVRDTPVTVGDQSISGVVITVTTDSARVQGSVRDALGRPALSASVICFPVEPERRRRYGTQPARIRSVNVATDGVYRLASLPAGDYFVVAVEDTLEDAWKDPSFLDRVSAAATRISVGWNETRTQDLRVASVK